MLAEADRTASYARLAASQCGTPAMGRLRTTVKTNAIARIDQNAARFHNGLRGAGSPRHEAMIHITHQTTATGASDVTNRL